MLLGFGMDPTISMFLIFTFIAVFSLALILFTEKLIEIQKKLKHNPYLTPSSLNEKAQDPEEWIKRVMYEIENGTIREVSVAPPSKRTLFRKKVEAALILIIIPSTVLISLINTYIFSQLYPGTFKFQLWAQFSVMSLIFLTIVYIITDRIERRKLARKHKNLIQYNTDFKMFKITKQKLLSIGSIILCIITVTLLYLYLTTPTEAGVYVFTINSPILIALMTIGIFSMVFIAIGFMRRIRKIDTMKDPEDHNTEFK